MVEFTKLIENQKFISLAQKTILTQLRNLEPGTRNQEPDTISNSGLSEEEYVPSPQIETIQPTNRLEPELITLNRKLQGILNRLNQLENPYR